MAKRYDRANQSRMGQENAENLERNVVDAPESRFQQEQQQATVVNTVSKPTDSEGFVRKESKSHGAVLRQEVAAETLKDGKGGSAAGVSSPSAFGLKAPSFSGDTGTILGNASGTPMMENSATHNFQGHSRVDKRISDANKDINFNASEQILEQYDAIPPLAASKSTVGYNGNPKNAAARSQKKTGFTSAEMLYSRSLDMIEKDAFVFSSGQVVCETGTAYDAYPTISYDENDNPVELDPERFVRGNFSPREIQVDITRDGGRIFISRFEVEEDDLSCNDEQSTIVNQSATNHMIDLNRAELSRQTIDADAGSPTSEHFNPLGRSIRQPTRTVTYLQDLENVCGAEIFAAYKFANKARAHFLNRTAKDGQLLVAPGQDALYGHLCGALDNEGLYQAFPDLVEDSFFSIQGMRRGSAALMIPLFDSVGKYRTKGDLVNQPRGLKMHIQTADNNMNPFRVKKEFVAALNSIDAYSTIDHEYDPLAPVYITDNVRLVHPYSWRESLGYTRENHREKVYTTERRAYWYGAGSGLNTYNVVMGDPLLNGVAYFLELHVSQLWRALNTNNDAGHDGTVTLTIPVVHSTTHFSLWDLLVCASTPYIIYERTNTMKDVLDYEMFYKYPLQGNVPIKDANPLNAVNYGALSPYSAIAIKQMLPSSAIRWKLPEVLTPMGTDFLLPYYFNERGFDFVEEGRGSTLIQNCNAEYTTPVVRSGIKLGGLDDFFGMDVKDQLLITDRMTRLPGNPLMAEFSGCIYKYGQESDGQVVIRSRYISDFDVTVRDWLSTPRLLGWYMDAPAMTCRCYDFDTEDGKRMAVAGGLAAAADINLGSMRPSFRAIEYKGIYRANDVIVDRPLQVGSVNVNRAQAFSQIWGAKWAGYEDASRFFDLCLSINEAIQFNDETGTNPRFVTISDRAQFSPFVYGAYAIDGVGRETHTTNTAYSIDVDDRPIVFSPHFMLWTLLQKTCFIINPFENSDATRPAADPYGVAYIFGLAGFMSANYDEEIYNRANQYQNEGYGYTVDPMTAESVIFKEAFSMTQIG